MDNGFVVAFLELRPASFSVGLADCSIQAEVIVKLTVEFGVNIGSPSVEFKRLQDCTAVIGLRERIKSPAEYISAVSGALESLEVEWIDKTRKANPSEMVEKEDEKRRRRIKLSSSDAS